VWPADADINCSDMEVLARKALWKAGIDFAHSSQSGSASLDSQEFGIHGLKTSERTKLEPGVCISVGPAYYKP
jgi:Xaa-Pro aminopeptidase